ncbi:MAG: cell division protein SepF [Clostridiales bacterium]|nr:MAG: cell division protein SepF [Clostridiales bacterium]
MTITTVVAITTAPGITSTDDTRRAAADTLTAATIRVATCPVPQKKDSTALLPPIGQPVRTQPTGQFVPPQQPAPQYAATPPQNPALQSVPIGNVVLYSPKNYGDVQSLIDHLRMHEPAIVEFAGIGDEDGQRILDFLSGAIYALGGSMQRINGTIFLLTPYGVSISAGGDIAKSIEERRNRR